MRPIQLSVSLTQTVHCLRLLSAFLALALLNAISSLTLAHSFSMRPSVLLLPQLLASASHLPAITTKIALVLLPLLSALLMVEMLLPVTLNALLTPNVKSGVNTITLSVPEVHVSLENADLALIAMILSSLSVTHLLLSARLPALTTPNVPSLLIPDFAILEFVSSPVVRIRIVWNQITPFAPMELPLSMEPEPFVVALPLVALKPILVINSTIITCAIPLLVVAKRCPLDVRRILIA
jgi:hypothetical protein